MILVSRQIMCRTRLSPMKLEQLQNMDAVREVAEVTIMAAAIDDASFGLPGVSSRPRIQQPSIRLRNSLFVSSGPQLQDLLGQST
jgi:hypothetical protein